MRAAVFEEYGGPEVIKNLQVQCPEPGPDHVRVKVRATSVNHVDRFVRSGAFNTELSDPAVISRDLVGVIDQVGSGVETWAEGDQVWCNSGGYDGRPGAAAEWVVAPADRVYPVPEGVDPLSLVSAVHPSATAAIALAGPMNIQRGEKLLVEGAAGHVGRRFVELGAIQGLSVTCTSDPGDFDALHRLGAERCLDYHAAFPDELTGVFDHIVDTSGQVDLQDNLNLLGLGGEVTLITAPASNAFEFSVRQFYMQQKQINGFVISHATREQLSHASGVLNQAFSDGRLLAGDLDVRPLEQASQAHADLASGAVGRRRIILDMNL